MSRPRLIALLLAFATLVVFLPASRFGFLNYDDTDYVTNNSFVKQGLTVSGLYEAFTTFHASNWHPLTWLSHMVDCTLFGLNPGAHHFINVLFHAANAALLFGLLFRVTGKLLSSALIAGLFAWHPLHVESVAWISERKDVLSTFFGLLALIAYARFVAESKAQSPKPKVFFAASLFCFALGLLAKPMLVTLPFILLLLDFWPLRRVAGCRLQVANCAAPNLQLSTFNFQLVTEKWPFFALSAASCLVTFLAQKNGEAVVSLANVSLRYRFENAPVAVVNYLLKLFCPTDLCAIYPLLENISATQVALAVTALALISLAAWCWREQRAYFLVGWLWFLGTLVPVIGLVQVGGTALADRYTYLPSIGFFIALIFLVTDLLAQFQVPKTIVAIGAAAVLVACIFATEFQLQFWRDSETLFRRAIAVTHNNEIALVNLGSALESENRLDEALVIDRQAEKIEPGRYQLHNNLGNILSRLGRQSESLAEYREAIRLKPDFSLAHLGAAKVLFHLGRDAEAVAELNVFKSHIALAPENWELLNTAAYFLAANENATARDSRTALKLALQANELAQRRQPAPFDVLGMALADIGDFTNAATCAQNALTLANAAQLKHLEPLEQRLKLYQNCQPWRESFRATNAPSKN